jgi:hypothetical protein|tara:strand:+ start:445 stop:948 length:504 start_codon:yes stop_codon:yes gene_type:complete
VFPLFADREPFVEFIIAFQAFLAILIVVGIGLSYRGQLEIIRGLLMVQSFMMILSNFNVYKEAHQESSLGYSNFEALNMLSSVFSVLFTFMNTFILHFLWRTFYERFLTVCFLFGSEFFVLVHTNFLFEGMSYHSAVSLTIAVIYMLILIPFFFLTCNGILEEYENE